MVYEQRLHRDYFFGNLLLAAAIADTTLSAAAFSALGTGYSTGAYLPLVLHNPSTGAYEVVWVTGHTAASQTVTVVRGREGTTAQAWPSNTQVIDAACVRDIVGGYTRALLPTDPHYGLRALVTDENVVVERTLNGWGPSVGVATPADVGPSVSNFATFPPSNSVITVRAGRAQLVADAGGNVTVTFRTPFPTGLIAFTATSGVFDSLGPYVVYASDRFGASIRAYNATTSPVAAGVNVHVSYIAVGY